MIPFSGLFYFCKASAEGYPLQLYHALFSSHQVVFAHFANAMAAWSDLNGKELSGIAGAYLSVSCPSLPDPSAGGLGGGIEPYSDANRLWQMQTNDGQGGKKYTCRLEIGIENDKE